MMRVPLTLVGAALWLAACAAPLPDGGRALVRESAQAVATTDVALAKALGPYPKTEESPEQRARNLLNGVLTNDAAAELALLQSPAVEAEFQSAAVADAQRARASSASGLHFSLTRLYRNEQGLRVTSFDQALTFNLLQWFTLPAVRAVEARRSAQAQASAAQEVLRLVAQVRKAHIEAVAAAQAERYWRDVKAVAETGAELAKRMQQAGNFNKLNQAREHAFYADAVVSLARAQHASVATRAHLARLLGMNSGAALQLPERLDDLPADLAPLQEAMRARTGERLDLVMIRRDTEALAAQLGLTQATRWINVLEFGPARSTETGKDSARGYEVSLELPLFDFGTARVAQAQALYQRQLQWARQAVLDAGFETRETWHRTLTQYDIARHYQQELLPLRKRISEEQLLRYNGMLIGVFELMADARAQVATVLATIDAQKDFWLAHVDWRMASMGKPVNGSGLALSVARAGNGAATNEGGAH